MRSLNKDLRSSIYKNRINHNEFLPAKCDTNWELHKKQCSIARIKDAYIKDLFVKEWSQHFIQTLNHFCWTKVFYQTKTYCICNLDNCTLADSERLEKIQLEVARIVTGLTSYASILSIYKETGWEKLSVRRAKRKLSLFYDIVSGQSPDYLQDLLPITVGQTNNYNLWNSKNFTIPPGRLILYQSSFFPKYY